MLISPGRILLETRPDADLRTTDQQAIKFRHLCPKSVAQRRQADFIGGGNFEPFDIREQGLDHIANRHQPLPGMWCAGYVGGHAQCGSGQIRVAEG